MLQQKGTLISCSFVQLLEGQLVVGGSEENCITTEIILSLHKGTVMEEHMQLMFFLFF